MSAGTTARPRPDSLQTGGGFFAVWTVLVLVFFHAPIALLIVYSFNNARFGIAWHGFTTRWYADLFRNEMLLRALQNSLLIASVATVLAVALGTLGAWLLHRYRFPGSRAIALLVFVPMAIPEVLMGVSLLLLFVALKMQLGFATTILAHTTFCFPFVLIAVQARLDGLDPHLEEAALDLGARPWQAFARVILPQLAPAIFSGALMAFALSMDEYIVTSFTAGPSSQTLPLKIFGMVKTGLNPQLNALSALFVAATVLLVIARKVFEKTWVKQSASPP